MKCKCRDFCVPAKPLLLILLFTIIIGSLRIAVLFLVTKATKRNAHRYDNFQDIIPLMTIIGTSIVEAALSLFYPLGGLLADVYRGAGRCRVITIGIVLIWFSLLMGILGAVFSELMLYGEEDELDIVGVLLLIAGIACYTSNIIQFGFDQLMDLPSYYLSMFVHWYVWADSLGNLLMAIANDVNYCYENRVSTTILQPFLAPSLGILLVFLTFLLIVKCIFYKRNMFTTHIATSNPYKLIYQVLKFTAKHKHRVGRPRADAVCEPERIPTRWDNVKNRFGGPFQDSDVEDVKTFTRVMYFLLTFVTVFILELPLSDAIFSLFTLHSGTAAKIASSNCTAQWIVLGGGGLSYLCSTVGLPLYIYLMFTVYRSRTPTMLVRIGVSISLCILAVLSLLVVDLTGHITLYAQNKTNIECMFMQNIIPNNVDVQRDTLALHWLFLIIPNLLIGIGPKLLQATLLEFISAQTPHTMKGVMVGVVFAIRGVSRLLSATLVIPFSLSFWKHGTLEPNPPPVSCAFGYFLVTMLVASVGLVWFTAAACKYKYRERNEGGVFSYEAVVKPL